MNHRLLLFKKESAVGCDDNQRFGHQEDDEGVRILSLLAVPGILVVPGVSTRYLFG